MNPCELTHYLYKDKPVSKYELHWHHHYSSDKYYISEQTYHDIMDKGSEDSLANWLYSMYDNHAYICMTITK